MDRLRDLERAAEREKVREPEKRAAAREGEARKQRFRNARYRLDVAEFEGPVFHLDGQGNRVYLEGDERAAKLKRARTAVNVDCR